MPPRTIGRYEVLTMVGRGGVGTVYRAVDRETGAPVAVKLLAPPPACDAAATRRLAREYEALRGLHHPNVVRVFDAGVHEGYSFLAMEMVEGLDLRSYLSPTLDEMGDGSPAPGGVTKGEPLGELEAWSAEPDTQGLLASDERSWRACGSEALREFAAMMTEPDTDRASRERTTPPVAPPAPRDGRVTPRPGGADLAPLSPSLVERLNRPQRVARLRDVMIQVCDGLAYVHSRGLVHRDLKPSNIMVDDLRRVRLMDFGLVKMATDPWDPHCVVGTYLYMAPEQAHGDPVDQRADLYSLGVVLFEMLCGKPPFTAPTPDELWQQISARPPPAAASLNPRVDAALAGVAERLLAKHPRERFQSAVQVAAELRR